MVSLALVYKNRIPRKAFPCWDEPIFKAKFDIALEVKDHLTAVSNMPQISKEKTEHGTTIFKFDTTPLMSSYLIAFAVGEFDYVEGMTKSGIPTRVYMVKGKRDQGLFALEIAIKAIDWYNDWFDLKYPLPKVDLIAVPDFNMGAMENWGLITFREVMLLADPQKSTTRMKIQISLIIAHEIAHFWFGDLVTMKWWSDLWLKEGFAKFMEHVLVHYNYPEYHIWEYFVGNNFVGGFELDSLKASHAIEVEIDNPNELDEIFDNITYAKSSCLNRMLCYYLSEPVFQDGLRRYLKKFQYNNAETIDLWNALSEASGQDIDTMMSSWTKHMGFPLVTVSQTIEPDRRILKLHQSRFMLDGGKDEEGHIWQIPINIITSSHQNEERKFLFNKREQEFVLEGVKPHEWVKLNSGTTGFYRVHYSQDMFQGILQAIENKELKMLDRFGVAEELFALVECGKVQADEFLTLVETCVKAQESDYVVWSALENGLSKLANSLRRHTDSKILECLNKFICNIFEPLAEKLGWEPKEGEGKNYCSSYFFKTYPF
uniref:Puromycin-sensitive aminopeptidase n=1 Tax=Acrobeloides nanus TaxID=290746 RepID=A0A914CYE7_9BILA